MCIATDRFALTDLPDPAEQQPILTGTSVAVARHLGVSVLGVRVAFVLLSLASGLGVGLYLIGWVLLARGHEDELSTPEDTPMAVDPLRSLGFGLIVVAALISATQAGLASWSWMFPAMVIAFGVMVAWRSAPDLSAGRAVVPGEPGSESRQTFRRDLLRQLGGAALVLGGVGLVVFSRFSFAALRDGLIAGLVVTIGIGLILGPWVLRTVRSAVDERRERVRSEERAEMAAHLHDSVLQTLTLIQKRSAGATDEGSREISTLARRQERELRRWLYGRSGAGAVGSSGSRFRSTVDELVADVEDLHGVVVEAVVVGDAPLDDALESLLGAVREAMVNAAKFSGRTEVSLYVELDETRVQAFVRDRGTGFDVDAIPADRHGVADSIIRRMRRAGGSATIRSGPGVGTEVELSLPRRALVAPDSAPDAAPEREERSRDQ